MHLPDGFLGPGTSASLMAFTAAVGAVAVRKIKKSFFARQKNPVLATPEGITMGGGETTTITKYGKNTLADMFLVGVFIFAAQMIDFTIVGGEAGHFLGGALAAILLGPLEGMIVLSAVLIIQALFLGDGGMVALGANIFNMAVVGAIGGYYIYYFLKKYLRRIKTAIFIAAGSSVVLASFAYSLESVIAGSSWNNNFILTHIIVGIGEGIITVLMLKAFGFKKKTD
ncbi:MAG: cobalamin biosynthesis protein CbiM [Candidatus Kerfeldbacteria bacterium CG_4_10_14_0_8_um_filter_42_10]|uniref:Cobalamin biosynthesis protein CbiM n=1 Tax=Candidatus Kerfeldbacteria bacterium CG_4_10_14_0_8_um_filter_42_10 TaxID=2014248 RepID=A0A2M7RJL4_9BACT|nr:MAG: cobalamin biosynthesis protein CbiM [Candidatus Kerfeldbacteria bacterium CG_4_10_14_0_8_um_filter_42_10]